MKIIEITSGFLLPITNEEVDLLKKFENAEFVSKSKLDEREQKIANDLVNKDVLLRKNIDGKVVYKKV